MGFLDFLIAVAKVGIGVIVGIVLMLSATVASVESVAIAAILGLIGLVVFLYGAYNLRQLDRSSY